MPDLVASVFRLSNTRFKIAPKTDFRYLESDTGVLWHISAGGSRAYLLRFGEDLVKREPEAIGNQNADSHFMMSRLKSALLVGGEGLYEAHAMGRIFLANVNDDPDWFTQLNLPTADPPEASTTVFDWLDAFTRHQMLRRAAEDAHAALTNPAEAGIFVYRGLEWLVVGEGRHWDHLAEDIGVNKSAINDFKKLVNVDFGVRHASRSGKKLRGEFDNYAYWVAALFDAMNATRARLDEDYEIPDPKIAAKAVAEAVPIEPYP